VTFSRISVPLIIVREPVMVVSLETVVYVEFQPPETVSAEEEL
jgi:hypothetical protein